MRKRKSAQEWEGREFDPIEVVGLHTDGFGQAISQRGVILAPNDYHYEAGVVSGGYNLVTNKTASQTGRQIIEAAQKDIVEEEMWFNGSHFRQRFTLGHAGTVAQGDDVSLVLDVVNSYDGTARYSIALNLVRLLCLNGMNVSNYLGGFSFKHSGESEDHVREVEIMVAKLTNVDPAPLVQRFIQMSHTYSSLEQIMAAAKACKVGSQTLGRALYNMENLGRPSKWDVYNAFTSVYRGLSPSTQRCNEAISTHFLKEVA
jgi:hypothetical protein